MQVEFIECPSGDWTVIKVDGKEFGSGHSISNWDVYELLRRAGCEVLETMVTDEQMESGDY